MISQRLRSYIFGHRWEYLKGFALGVVATGVALIAPSVLRRAVDGIRGGISSQALLGLAATYVALALAAATLRFFWRGRALGPPPPPAAGELLGDRGGQGVRPGPPRDRRLRPAGPGVHPP